MVTPIVLLPPIMLLILLAILPLCQKISLKEISGAAPVQIITMVAVFGLLFAGMNGWVAYHAHKIRLSLNIDALDQMLYHVDRLDRASLNLHPSAPIYRVSMMLALINQGVVEPDQKDQAIDEMQRYISEANRRNPHNPENLFYKGMIMEQQGDVQQAAALWRQALTLDPSYLSARTKLMQHYQNDQNRLLELIEGGLPIRYWKQDPMQFYAIGLVFAAETNNTELHNWIRALMQRRMQLR